MAFLRMAAPVSANRTDLPAACTSTAVAKRALLPGTPTISAAIARPAAHTIAAVNSDRFREEYGILPPRVGGTRHRPGCQRERISHARTSGFFQARSAVESPVVVWA